jgi:uncharacterized protein (DUF302 family)
MRRISASFPETMTALQSAIVAQGYKVYRVQRIDIGLTKTGHQTDRYRLVFFAKSQEIRYLMQHYPELSPLIPIKFVIYAEDNDTLILTHNTNNLAQMYPDKQLADYFTRWNQDIVEILESTRQRVQE